MKINSKAFAILNLTAIYNHLINRCYKPDAVRIGIANALDLIFILRMGPSKQIQPSSHLVVFQEIPFWNIQS